MFGQFEEAVLPAAMTVLDNSSMRPIDRGDPIKVNLEDFHKLEINIQVSRVISAMVNDVDDYGVIAGNWSGKYDVRLIYYKTV